MAPRNGPKLTAELLLGAVRCELEKYQRQREGETNASRRDMLGGAMLACSNILAALQIEEGE
jgi:hypothetical protein